ncbi:unnamed protein product [Urochloa humidicola]
MLELLLLRLYSWDVGGRDDGWRRRRGCDAVLKAGVETGTPRNCRTWERLEGQAPVAGTVARLDVVGSGSLLLPSFIHNPRHNISPSLGKQLVLELEGGVSFFECINGFPCSFRCRHLLPFDEDVPHATA